MEAILISDMPRWCALMMNGIKKIEIRKNKALAGAIQKLIQKYGYAEIYVYCSKHGGNLVYGAEYRGDSFIDEYGITKGYSKQKANEIFGLLNGKVVFKFRCYKVGNIFYNDYYEVFMSTYLHDDELSKKSCVSQKEMADYFGTNGGNCGYAIHISDLEIFNKPKELSEFLVNKDSYGNTNNKAKETYKDILTKAPQNMVYVEALS